ncbi:MAG TPA: SDR family oxidoreductase, partial [Steroidobacteraceae bacterium]
MESAASRRDFLATGAVAALPLAAARAAGNKTGATARSGLLAGKRAVIYGAAGAMGSAIARAFAREGAQLFLAGRTPQNVQALADELVEGGANAVAARLDAQDREAVDKHLDEVVRAAGGIDISFNLIGLGGLQGQPLTAMTQAQFAEPIESAMRTHFYTAIAAARHMEKGGSGVLLALT